MEPTITHSDSIKKITPAIFNVQSQVSAVSRTKVNDFHKYKYADLQQFVNTVKPLLIENKLMIIEGVPIATELSNGRMLAKLEVMLLHTSGEWFRVVLHGEGSDISTKGSIGDKGLYKATTGARKYAMACLFNIATTDDPEKTTDKKPRTGKADMSNAAPLGFQENVFVNSISIEAFGEHKDGKKWHKFAVEIGDEIYYTFDEDVARAAKRFAESGVPVAFESKHSEKSDSYDILSIMEMPVIADSIVSELNK